MYCCSTTERKQIICDQTVVPLASLYEAEGLRFIFFLQLQVQFQITFTFVAGFYFYHSSHACYQWLKKSGVHNHLKKLYFSSYNNLLNWSAAFAILKQCYNIKVKKVLLAKIIVMPECGVANIV